MLPLLLAGVLTALSGCAPPPVEKARFFFPPPPAQPRLEYIKFVQSDHDVTVKKINWVEDAIFGRETPYPLFTDPYDVAADGLGRVLVSDLGSGDVLVLDDAEAKVRYLRDAKGDRSVFVTPFAVAFDSEGFAAVSDIFKKELIVYGPDEREQARVKLDKTVNPVGLAMDRDRMRIFLADSLQHKVHLYSYDGTYLESWGGRGKALGEFNYPVDVDLDRDGNLYVLDALNYRVQVFSADGQPRLAFGEQGMAAGSFMMPKGLAVSPAGLVMVTDGLAHRFVIFNTSGSYLLTVGGKGMYTNRQVLPGGFYLPRGIAADPHDGLWVVDSLNRTLHQFQYLSDEYLSQHPIQPGEAFRPGR